MHALRSYRQEKNLSLRHFAEGLGVTEAQVSRIELGKRDCTPEMAIKIEDMTVKAVPRWVLRPDLWSAPVEVA